MRNLTASQILQNDGHLLEIIGDPDRAINRVSPLSIAGRGGLTFSRSAAPELIKRFRGPLSGATVICPERLDIGDADVTLIVGDNPRLSFMRAVRTFFALPAPRPGIHPSATVAPGAIISSKASIGPGVVVGPNCSIGDGSVLHPNVVLYDNVKIGQRVTIHAGSVVGADGFGYERNERGELEKFPHIGGVTIMDDVEIGSNTSIDRGALEDTIICERARIDNQVHIAHNVRVGRDAAVIAQAMIGGSVQIGDRAWIAPSATIMNKADIGPDATVGLGAVVVKAVGAGETVMGSPAVPDHEFREVRAAIKRLLKD
jgi:UDP-3-O-[3-hydroxymyristoyl] glucosamine N-acyltransferase